MTQKCTRCGGPQKDDSVLFCMTVPFVDKGVVDYHHMELCFACLTGFSIEVREWMTKFVELRGAS